VLDGIEGRYFRFVEEALKGHGSSWFGHEITRCQGQGRG